MDDKAKQEVVTHLKEHMTHPATKSSIVHQCNHMSHIPESTRQWVENSLVDRTYKSADDVIKTLGL